MTATNFREFEKLWKKIPQDRISKVNFLPIRSGTKIPERPFKNQRSLTYYDVKHRLCVGSNIGVCGRPGGIMVLDIDVDENKAISAPKSILDEIPSTFTVRTRAGGLHYYFLNDGDYPNQIWEYGELRTNWQYVLSPGSWVEKTYVVENDVPIAKFMGNIVNLFRMERVLESSKEKRIIQGNAGKPISETATTLTRSNTNVTEDRRKQILNILKRKSYGKF